MLGRQRALLPVGSLANGLFGALLPARPGAGGAALPTQSPGFVKHMNGDESETSKLLCILVASSGFESKSPEMPSSFLKFHFFIMKIILSFTSPEMSKTNKHFIHVSKDA